MISLYFGSEHRTPPAGAQSVFCQYPGSDSRVQGFMFKRLPTCGTERRMQPAGAPGEPLPHGAPPTPQRGALPATPPPPPASALPAHGG